MLKQNGMGVMLRRPILVGGIGLSFSLWLWQSWHESVFQVGEFGLMGAIALGAGLWLLKQQASPRNQLKLAELPLNRAKVEQAIAQAEGVVNQLEAEAENHAASAELWERVAQLKAELDRQEIRIAVTGGKAVGKSTLIQLLETSQMAQMLQKLHLSETPALFTKTANAPGGCYANAADLVLFLTTGDLTEPEFETLQQLTTVNQRTMLVFNKQDQYLPEERASVLHNLRQRLESILKTEDVVAIAASPSPIKVRQHQADGSVQEWMEQSQPEIAQLTQQLAQIAGASQQLVWATTKRSAVALKAEAKTVLNGVRRDRAVPVVEQYQWIAAAAAFANPVPALDLLATAAITAQMVVDLGAVYQQKFSFPQAQTTAGTLGKLMLQLGLVEISTKTISTVLKSNAITFVAGGVVQGVSAAYLTRLAGLSLIEYFQQQEVAANPETGLNLDKLSQTVQKVFHSNQQITFLQGFVQQGLGRLLPKSPQPQLTNSETVV